MIFTDLDNPSDYLFNYLAVSPYVSGPGNTESARGRTKINLIIINVTKGSVLWKHMGT